jgi:hypothetical protein
MITTPTLTTLRRFQESSFVETATIVDPKGNAVSDGAGGITYTPATIGTEKCRVAAMTLARAEVVLGGQLQGSIPWEIALPIDTAARETHQITVNGQSYEVVALWGPSTYGTTTKAICMKVGSNG